MPLLFFILLIIVVPIVFAPCLQAQFLHWDDYGHYLLNPYIYTLSWQNIANIFQQTINETYIPLTTLSFNLEYHFFGFSPFVSHLINIILHVAVVIAIFDFARKLEFSPWESFVACLLFAIHPIHVESVAWVTERKDVLGILFYVLCLNQYCSYLKTQSKVNYGWSIFLGFLSILTKAMAVSIPWVLLLMDWYCKRPWNKRVLLDKLPFAILIFFITTITLFKLSPHLHVGGNSILIGLWTFSWYLDKFFVPFNLTPVYAPPVPIAITNFIYLKSLLIFIVFCLLLFWNRRHRLFVFASLFWVLTIFIFWRMSYFDNNIVADRFMYLPSLGFCLFLGKYLSKFRSVALIVFVFLGVLTFNQCGYWRNDLSLWTWALVQDPKNIIAQGKADEAIYDVKHIDSNNINIKLLSQGIDCHPLDAARYIQRGEVYLSEGNNFFAFNDFNKAIKIDPNNYKSYDMRGQLYVLRLDFKKAFADFDKAIALRPDNPTAYFEKGLIFTLMRDTNQALYWFDKSLLIKPIGGAYFERAMLYALIGQHQKAINDFSQSILLGHNLKNSYYQRGKSYEALKQFDKAIEDLNRALKTDPYDVKIFDDLGLIYIKKGDFAQAIQVLNKAIRLHPYNGNSYNNRGIAFLHLKQYDLALKDFTSVVQLNLYPYHALITRGDLYLAFGMPKQALKDYAAAMSISNGDTIAKMKYVEVEQK